jgi:hypothetical protein
MNIRRGDMPNPPFRMSVMGVAAAVLGVCAAFTAGASERTNGATVNGGQAQQANPVKTKPRTFAQQVRGMKAASESTQAATISGKPTSVADEAVAPPRGAAAPDTMSDVRPTLAGRRAAP